MPNPVPQWRPLTHPLGTLTLFKGRAADWGRAMRFALLGYDPQAGPLLDALGKSTDHSIDFALGVPDEALGDLIAGSPGLRICESWEDLLSSTFDRLIFAGHDPTLLEGSRQIAADGQAIVLIPHAAQGTAFIYSLSLVHDDNQVPLIPMPALATNPLIDELCERVQAGGLGEVMLLRLERQLESRGSFLTRPEVDAALLEDVSLLRKIGGSYDRVTAVHAGGDPEAISQATVTLAGQNAAEASWLCRPGSDSWQLTVSGSEAEARLTLDLSSPSGRLEIEPTAGETTSESTTDRQAISQSHLVQATRLDFDAKDWPEMTRTFETVEATHTSLRRRRTIDLYFETTSERSIFKSQMTAMGCGLLLLTLFGLVAFLLLGAFLDSRSVLQRNAEAGGRVVQEAEFTGGTAFLNPAGEQHIEELARKLERKSESVFVMPSEEDEQEDLDLKRVAAVTDALVERGRPEAMQLVALAELPNAFVQGLLKVLRVAWIAPLVLFLAMQTLLFITRPPAQAAPTDDSM
jgi:hypothetical protein